VVAFGAGTSVEGHVTPLNGGISLDLSRMTEVLSINQEDLDCRVQAGITRQSLNIILRDTGLFFPVDPGGEATLGGMCATRASGTAAVHYGTIKENVLGLTVVMANGDVVQTGGRVRKSSTGYDLTSTMIGSEGTLGIITEMTLKLIPAPKEVVSIIVMFEDLSTCISTVPKLLMAHLQPQALEFMERDIVISSEAYLGKSVFPQKFDGKDVNAYLLMTFDGENADQLDEIIEQASEVVLEAGALDVLVADTPALKKDAWAARSSFLEAIEADTKLLDELDVVVPSSKIAEYLDYIKSLEANFNFKIKSFGHAGDGNLHIYTCSNDMELDEFKKQVAQFMEKAYAKATECGGLISGEHGIGAGKKHYLEKMVGPVQMRLMRDIKKAFDPNGILNPGKICS
ncbi:MAG TPA: 2-hydroxy-acid oxidase, partial [Ruminococcaceae bacterium]|nr:2-hydroxy-acid oxidase [Oscillospiraceae bacterium]